mmetsp:Transcript_9688/g.12000  ORF Transcript_9688/g.12000 Transcript_9688/m.12000 type:complete len:241 (-) Transcript_9688:140-862(-)
MYVPLTIPYQYHGDQRHGWIILLEKVQQRLGFIYPRISKTDKIHSVNSHNLIITPHSKAQFHQLRKVRCRPGRRKCKCRKRLSPPLGTIHPMSQRKLHPLLRKLHRIRPLQIPWLDLRRPNNLNTPRPRPVPTGHFVIKLRNRTSQGNVPELPVHIMRTGATRVTQPNAVVFNDFGALFAEFNAVEDFTRGFLHFAELVHKVPELRFGNDGIGGEDDHAVGFRVGIFGGRGFSADYLVAF